VIWVIWFALILLGLGFIIRDILRPKSRRNPPIPTIPPPLEAQINRLRNELANYRSLQTSMIRQLEARIKTLESHNND
jgi:hypothetical protein